jgi:UDP-glucose 4-epimerase
MRILVTGGAGYVGSVSVEAFLEAGHEVTVLDDLSTGHRPPYRPARPSKSAATATPPRRDRAARARIDAVLHCAAKSLVGESMTDPAKYFRENVAGGIALLDGDAGRGCKRIVFSSTAATYGMPERTPILESDPIRPINAYGESKRCVEAAIAWYGHGYGFRSVILRYFNVAGASRRNGEQHAPETHLIPAVLNAAERARDDALRRGLPHSRRNLRPRLHPRRGPGRGPPGGARGDGPGRSRDRPGDRAVPAAHLQPRQRHGLQQPRDRGRRGGRRRPPIAVKMGPRRAGDPPVLVASADRARRELGWQPRHGTIEEMIGSAWEWRRATRPATPSRRRTVPLPPAASPPEPPLNPDDWRPQRFGRRAALQRDAIIEPSWGGVRVLARFDGGGKLASSTRRRRLHGRVRRRGRGHHRRGTGRRVDPRRLPDRRADADRGPATAVGDRGPTAGQMMAQMDRRQPARHPASAEPERHLDPDRPIAFVAVDLLRSTARAARRPAARAQAPPRRRARAGELVRITPFVRPRSAASSPLARRRLRGWPTRPPTAATCPDARNDDWSIMPMPMK